jgi:hypothetical protein
MECVRNPFLTDAAGNPLTPTPLLRIQGRGATAGEPFILSQFGDGAVDRKKFGQGE